MLLNIRLEPVSEDAFIRLEGSKGRPIVSPDLNVAAEDGPLRHVIEGAEHAAKPVRMCATIGVHKAKNIASGSGDTAIAGQSRPWVWLQQQARTRMSHYHRFWR